MIPEVEREISGMAIESPVYLYQIDLNPIGVNTIYYLSPHRLNGAAVAFDGVSYPTAALSIEGITQDGSGEPSAPTFTLDNSLKFVSTLTEAYADLVKARVTRIKTLKTFLDGQPMANGDAYLSKDRFEITRKKTLNHIWGTFELRPLSSVEGKVFPAQVCTKNGCSRSYRRWNGASFTLGTCPYNGTPKFTRQGVSTTDPTLDVCSKDYKGCSLRYPNGVGLPAMPTWAFFGMQELN